MHAHPRRLVDNGDAFVFVNHVKGDIFCKSLERRQLDCAADDDFFSAAQLHGGLGGFSIDQDLFLPDQLLNADAAHIRKLGYKPLVKTHADSVG